MLDNIVFLQVRQYRLKCGQYIHWVIVSCVGHPFPFEWASYSYQSILPWQQISQNEGNMLIEKMSLFYLVQY